MDLSTLDLWKQNGAQGDSRYKRGDLLNQLFCIILKSYFYTIEIKYVYFKQLQKIYIYIFVNYILCISEHIFSGNGSILLVLKSHVFVFFYQGNLFAICSNRKT